MPTGGGLTDKAIEAAGGLAEFKRQGENYSENLRFLESIKKDVLQDFDKSWIAVFNSSIVAANKSLPDLVAELTAKGIPENSALIQYISNENILTLYNSQ